MKIITLKSSEKSYFHLDKTTYFEENNISMRGKMKITTLSAWENEDYHP